MTTKKILGGVILIGSALLLRFPLFMALGPPFRVVLSAPDIQFLGVEGMLGGAGLVCGIWLLVRAKA